MDNPTVNDDGLRSFNDRPLRDRPLQDPPLQDPPLQDPPLQDQPVDAESLTEPNDPDVYYMASMAPPPVATEPKPSRDAPEELEPTFPARVWRGIGSLTEWLFGVASILLGLAVLASLPIAQFLSLGYLLESSGRVARSGRIRDAFIGVRKAARMGGVVLGAGLMYLPLLLVNDLWYTSHLVDSGSAITANLRVVQLVVTGLIVMHVTMAWYCGGRLRDYFWPLYAPRGLWRTVARGEPWNAWFPPAKIATDLLRGDAWQRSRDGVWDFVTGLHLPFYFWLGLRGFIGAAIWLAPPILIIVVGQQFPTGLAVLAGLVGSLGLAVVLLYLPFLQAHFAAENRLSAMFQWSHIRECFRRAPIAFWFALFITLLFALPLYLLKIEFLPGEMLWIPSLVFVTFIFPARVITGWALGRARRHDQPRFFLSRWIARLAAIPVVLAFVGMVFITQYLSWNGVYSLFEQHAFLTPVPFLGM